MKYLVVFIIFIFSAFQFFLSGVDLKKRQAAIVSFIIQIIPFAIGKTIISLLNQAKAVGDFYEIIGPFGNDVRVEFSFLIFIFLVIIVGFKARGGLDFLRDKWVLFFIILCVISLIVPGINYKWNFLPLMAFILQILFILSIIKSNLPIKTIYEGIFDGLTKATVLQFFLTILYPILHLEAAVLMFQGDSALDWTMRREGYPSAVGIFTHPGILAFYTLINMIFFLSSYLNGVNKKRSLILIFISLFIIFFTYSRTTYVSMFIVSTFLYITAKTKRSFFTFRNLAIAIFTIVVLGGLLVTTALSDIFLKSDSDAQVINRLMHYYIGYEIWNTSKLFGVGINNHISYMLHTLSSTSEVSNFLFFFRSPIHNIHLIVLCEIGLIGFLSWIYYFYSRINLKFSQELLSDSYESIFILAKVGVLLAVFIYGFVGWTPFQYVIMSQVLIVSYFSKK